MVYQFVDKRKLDRMTDGENHQGVAAFAAAHKYADVGDILAAARAKNEPPFIIIADGLNDPHNLGSIIRSANAAGAHGVIIPKNRSVSLNSVVAKVSTGAVEIHACCEGYEYCPNDRKTQKRGALDLRHGS